MNMSLQETRRVLSAMGNHSHTTDKFQNDLIGYAEAFSAQGDCIIEVGCFRGGLTAQFALVGKRLGQHVHVVDIDPGYMQVARDSIEATGGTDNVTFHLGDFDSFIRGAGRDVRSSLTLIDGDHFYNGVVADIRALLAMRTRPFGVAFHDYSLRYAKPEGADIRVDRAIHDVLGADFPHVAIGELAVASGPLRTTPHPDDTHFHELGQSEGVLVEFRPLFA